jgi:metallo-beta-lactamase family protein
MVDCGLYQGERKWRRLNWEPLSAWPSAIEGVVLTHTHLDHCGYLPALVRQGFAGPVWCTEGTAALGEIVLRDSARLQEEDAAAAQAGGWSKHDPALPLYTVDDAARAIALARVIGFGLRTAVTDEWSVTLSRAGHVLGSASALLESGDASILFSGDLGRPSHPLLRPRSGPPAARTVVLESTYGDREHPLAAGTDHEVLASTIRRTIGRGGSVVIPAFAVDRTELVLHALAGLLAERSIPSVPVFVDSPMALAALDVYRRPSMREELLPGVDSTLGRLPRLHAARSAADSVALDNPGTPSMIISASGMATGGRVIHHLRHLLPHARNAVVLTGYQAVGTRGRALQEGASEVKIMGRYVPVRAEVVTDEGFSVHADAGEMTWLEQMPKPPETVYLVHGEVGASDSLADRIRKELGWTVAVPRYGERVRVD